MHSPCRPAERETHDSLGRTLDYVGASVSGKGGTLSSVVLLRHSISLALALFSIACGGGGSRSDDDVIGSGNDPEIHSFLVRWREIEDVAGYVVHWGRSSGAYTDALDVGSPAVDGDGVINFYLDRPGPGGTIYFALTSYDDDRRMSGFSNELSVDVP